MIYNFLVVYPMSPQASGSKIGKKQEDGEIIIKIPQRA